MENREIANKLAVVKLLKTKIAEIESELKHEALVNFDEKDRKSAMINGVDVGTVSKTEKKVSDVITVVDDKRFIKWCLENDKKQYVQRVIQVSEFISDLDLENLKKEGADGLDVVQKIRDSYVLVRQSERQKNNIIELFQNKQITMDDYLRIENNGAK
jgi:hypothetical protein